MKVTDRLIEAAKKACSEGVESSKNIIKTNIVPSFDAMSNASVNPGEFAQAEITDTENLVNRASMSNDTDFNKEDNCAIQQTIEDKLEDLLDISAMPEGEVAEIEVVKKDHAPIAMFGESTFAKFVKTALNGKSCEEYLMESGDWAGPKSFVPDMRVSAADVLNILKNKLGDKATGIHVDQEIDANKNNVYRVTQIDKEELPEKLQIENTILVLDDNIYTPEEVNKEYPVTK